MPFVPANNTAQVEMVCLWGTQMVENVYNFEFATSLDAEILEDLAIAMFNWWSAGVRGNCPSNFSLQKIIVKDQTSQNSVAIEYTAGLPLSGTNVNAYLPNNVAVAVKYGTGLRGRSYRGRTYYMPIPSSWVADNTLTAGVASGLVSVYNGLKAIDAGGIATKFSVVSKQINNTFRTSAVVTEIISVSVDPICDSQRRRLPGRGG